jgi:hypothetical protein
MFQSWFSAVLLAFESNDVVRLRLARIAAGGSDAYDEASLMWDEKVAAALEAYAAIWNGSTTISVIERYREHVAANRLRLSAQGRTVAPVA